MSPPVCFGPERASRDVRYVVAVESKAEVTRASQEADLDPFRASKM
jgi:hypothetical protein